MYSDVIVEFDDCDERCEPHIFRNNWEQIKSHGLYVPNPCLLNKLPNGLQNTCFSGL
jgi:hypothetical protein